MKALRLLYHKVLPRLWITPRKGVQKAYQMFRNGGIRGVIDVFSNYMKINRRYQRWFHALPTPAAPPLDYQPLISVVMPVYNVDEVWLRAAIESVRRQTYTHWEFCIVDDASTRTHIKPVLEEYQRLDARIKVIFNTTNEHISRASNRALSLATGEFIALLDHDDEIPPHALYEVVKRLNTAPDTDFIYTDEDKLETDGTPSEPFFKPGWSPYLLLSFNYITHFAVIRRTLVEAVGGFHADFVGSQDYDLFLRVLEKTTKVQHLPQVLYHWRKVQASTSTVADVKEYAKEAQRRAAEAAIIRRGCHARIEWGSYYPFVRMRPVLPAALSVSLVVSLVGGKNLRHVHKLMAENTAHELILVAENAGALKQQFPQAKRVDVPAHTRTAQALQAGAQQSSGDYLVFLTGDLLPTAPAWLTALLEMLIQPQVGVVGAKIVRRSGRIEQAGISLAANGSPQYVGSGLMDIPQGLVSLNLIKDAIREVSAVSHLGMAVSRARFGTGFDPQFQHAWFDVDLCLRLAAEGYTNLYTPYARFLNTTPKINPAAADLAYLQTRWQGFTEKYDLNQLRALTP